MVITTRRRVSRKARASTSTTTGRVYGYARVSTSHQADAGLSLEVQQQQIEGYAQMLGRKLDRVYIERAVSGSKPLPEREQGGILIGDLKPGDTLIAAKLDRVFRSAEDALHVMESMRQDGVALHLIDLGGDVTSNGGNTVSKLVFTILAAVAEAERDRIRERISEAKADQRRKGQFLGGSAPYGYRRVGKKDLEPIPEKADYIRRMVRYRDRGYSLRKIQETLDSEGEHISLMSIDRAIKTRQAQEAARHAARATR